LEIKKFAAIDIGSNSVRLLIVNVLENEGLPLFKKSSLIRVPVRLGANAFTDHKIPEVSIKRLIDAMTGFRHLMRANDVIHYKGCATSAMREAANAPLIVKRIKKEAGIDIDVITGNVEAHLIFNSQNANAGEKPDDCIFIDVGGGSTEITIFADGKAVAAKSFKIGTIRILQQQVTKNDWLKMKDWLKEKIGRNHNYTLLGSGGNINRISKIAQLKPGKSITLDKLEQIVEHIKSFSLEDRIKKLDLNPDRADVIVPAGEIFINLMKWMAADKIFIPKIGLGDGIVRQVYKEYLNGQKKQLN
jgi:exopolyphosphatase/guanosine-5'-triphosphate,3'-diphosphate pyrophosphatase